MVLKEGPNIGFMIKFGPLLVKFGPFLGFGAIGIFRVFKTSNWNSRGLLEEEDTGPLGKHVILKICAVKEYTVAKIYKNIK